MTEGQRLLFSTCFASKFGQKFEVLLPTCTRHKLEHSSKVTIMITTIRKASAQTRHSRIINTHTNNFFTFMII